MIGVQECLKILRRRVGDTEEPFTFEDELLEGYIEDAVGQVEIDYPRGIVVTQGSFNKEINLADANLFVIKAHYLVKLRTKEKADRDNFLMKKGRLTLDNTNQSSDHRETLEFIEREYKRALVQVRNNGHLKGVRME